MGVHSYGVHYLHYSLHLTKEEKNKTTFTDLPNTPTKQVDQCEGHIIHPGKTIMELCWNTNDIIDSKSQPLQSKVEGEIYARQLLEEHIKYITVVVKQLNKDIEVLQEEIRRRDNVSHGTNAVLKSLELRHVNGIGELRGRVARCDASIAKLSADLMSIYEGIQNLSKEQQKAKLTLEAKIKDVEGQISELLKRVEEYIREQQIKIGFTGEQNREQPHLLDIRMKSITEDIKDQVLSSCSRLEQKLARKEQELMHQIELISLTVKDKTESSEKSMEDRINQLSVKLDKIEAIQKTYSELHDIKQVEDKLNLVIASIEMKIWKEIEDIEAETNVATAFDAVLYTLLMICLLLSRLFSYL
ncbi:protein FAM81A-like isoform X2 [Scyliorhinus canicula]|uniref:protein FAM81A-like isoform X2 n=1 Tax=Scyliorhinus canicula TaxID=7830 RepID=UPI0018F42D99|nr:protein FAM81A-like isoform X2 [Scyliorhinus canicula]